MNIFTCDAMNIFIYIILVYLWSGVITTFMLVITSNDFNDALINRYGEYTTRERIILMLLLTVLWPLGMVALTESKIDEIEEEANEDEEY